MDNLACIYMDGKVYECPFTDCETKSDGCFCKRKLDFFQEKEKDQFRDIMKRTISKDKIVEENNKLEKIYLEFKDNKLKIKNGVIDFKIFCVFILEAINGTLSWCSGINPEPPSAWIIPTLERWRVAKE